MKLSDLDKNSSSNDWDKKWAEIFSQYQNDLRHAYYIHAMLAPEEKRILEIGAGSFRDMAELRRRGVDCEGMDFSIEAVNLAKDRFPKFSSSSSPRAFASFAFAFIPKILSIPLIALPFCFASIKSIMYTPFHVE